MSDVTIPAPLDPTSLETGPLTATLVDGTEGSFVPIEDALLGQFDPTLAARVRSLEKAITQLDAREPLPPDGAEAKRRLLQAHSKARGVTEGVYEHLGRIKGRGKRRVGQTLARIRAFRDRQPGGSVSRADKAAKIQQIRAAQAEGRITAEQARYLLASASAGYRPSEARAGAEGRGAEAMAAHHSLSQYKR
jgi:hypothetical protein